MEEAGLVAGGAVAFVEADGGGFVCGIAEGGRWEGQEYDVTHKAAVAGAVVGAAGRWGGGRVGGR